MNTNYRKLISKDLEIIRSIKTYFTPFERSLFDLLEKETFSEEEIKEILANLDLGIALRLKDLKKKRAVALKDAFNYLEQFRGSKIRFYYTVGLMDIEFLGRLIRHPFLDGIFFLPEEKDAVKFSICHYETAETLEKEGKDWKEVLNEIYLMIIERLEKAGFKIENIAFISYEEWSKWIE